MNKLYSKKIMNQIVKVWLILLIITLGTSRNNIFAEGTKQLAPVDGDRLHLALCSGPYGNLGIPNGDDGQRLYIHIEDPANEQVFLGFSQFKSHGHAAVNSSKIEGYFRIKDPNGNVVWSTSGSIGSGNISSRNKAIKGPNKILGGGRTDGYNAYVFQPTILSGAGDYYIEFNRNSAFSSTGGLYTEWWDITVATNNTSPSAIDGRVYSKGWSFVSPGIDENNNGLQGGEYYNRKFNGKFYSYCTEQNFPGGYVTEVDFENSGFQGASFNVAFNSTGTNNTNDFTVNRKSLEDVNILSPEFKIFLNEPEITSYPSADSYGRFIADEKYPSLFGCPGNYFFRVAVEKKGRIELLLDFDGVKDKYDPNTRDRIITTLFHPYPHELDTLIRDIPWDGKDGKGNVIDAVNVRAIFDYCQGTFHFPMYDVEYLKTGIVPKTIRPATPTPYTTKLYWDDANISESLDDGQPKVELTGALAPSHNWSNFYYGEVNSINTYWNSYQTGTINTFVFELPAHGCDLFVPGSISGTVFNDINRDGIMNGADALLEGAEVYLYEDVNNNKIKDAGDVLVETFVTKTPGTFGYPVGTGNFLFKPAQGKEYLLGVSNGSDIVTTTNYRYYTMYSEAEEHFDQYFGLTPAPEVSLSVSKTQVSENAEESVIQANLSYAPIKPVVVELEYTGTTVSGDYSLASVLNATDTHTMEFPIGVQVAKIKVTSVEDEDLEVDETIIISLGDLTNCVGGSSTQKTITILDNDHDVKDLVDINSTANIISENILEDGIVFITARATDEDGDEIIYSLTNNFNNWFKIDEDSGVVTVHGNVDYESNLLTAHKATITVLATSDDGSSISEVFTITITNAVAGDTDNEISAITDDNIAANEVSENASNGDSVGITAEATDADAGDVISYSLTDNAGGRFAIDASSGVITVADEDQLDYEAATSHNVTVKALSTDGSSKTKIFTIAVINADGSTQGGGDTDNEISAITDTNTAANQISENASNGDSVGITAEATDADAGDVISYSLTDNADGRFAIDSDGKITVADDTKLNYEDATSHDVTVKALSTDGSSKTKTFTIAVINADGSTQGGGDTDNPVGPVTDSNTADNKVNENATVGASTGLTAKAIDPDGDNVSYAIDGSVPFSIDPTSGVVKVNGNLDFDTTPSYLVKVIATSTDGSTSEETFTITIVNADGTTTGEGDTDNPVGPVTDSNSSDNKVNENAAIGASTGLTAEATDPDGDLVTYAIDGSVPFTINPTSGVVTVNGNLDFDTTPSYSVKVIATSTDGSTSEETFTITIVNADGTTSGEGDTDNPVGPVTDSNTADNKVNENATVGASTGLTAKAIDPDGDDVSYSIDG
ncbi:cadherin repeat domain-containing protein, partial [Labilibaculum sp. DW002]